MDKKLVIIDGNSLINRAFYALPDFTTREGLHTNAIYGFTTMLFKIIENYEPTHISVAFDLKAPTFRHKQYKEYKANRSKMADELRQQMQPLKELLDAFNIHRMELEGFEADDLIGTLSKLAEENEFKTFIVTGDKDALQLASQDTKVLITKKGISELEEYTDQEVIDKYELTPLQFIDLKGLMGDKSDNIPGVPGIGEKTGIKLLKQFGSVENLIMNTDSLKGKQKEKIEENSEIAVLSKKLATIVRDIPLEIDLDELRFGDYDKSDVVSKLQEFEFTSLIEKIGGQVVVQEPVQIGFDSIIKEDYSIESLIEDVKRSKTLFMKICSESGNIRDERIDSAFLSADGENIYYTDSKDDILRLKDMFEDESVKKCGYRMKGDYTSLRAYGITLEGIGFDIAIAEYLIDSTSSRYEYEDIAMKYLSRSMPSKEDLLGKGKKAIGYGQLEADKKKDYFSGMLNVISGVKPMMEEKIVELELSNLFENIEMPLVEVLGNMEHEGFYVDREKLAELDVKFSKIIDELTADIYGFVEEEFNINSPKQLGVILFEELELPVVKKTKTGYSTSVEVLEKLKGQHPIIEKIMEYRQIGKLKSTYVDGLLKIINENTGRIHSSFNQTITTTGRISSTEPNLQNIPVRMELGREIRKVFIPKANHSLVDADYSQIELRVLAHMSGDQHLIEAFKNEEDIHAITAAKVFGVELSEVTKDMRGEAKAVNFGIVYGISDFGLSQNLNIPVKQAKEYIKNYFDKYPGVKTFMDEVVDQCKKDGYVTTILNRRRYIPEINSRNFIMKNLGKRLAMNTPIQGSAADVIKMAMVRVYKRLKESNLKSQLILQVHDELIIEATDDELETIKTLLREEMEKAIDLSVPMKVDLSFGNSWYETK